MPDKREKTDYLKFCMGVERPPNYPQAKSIEEFWGLLSKKIYDNERKAVNGEQLRRRFHSKFRQIDVAII